jgi:MoaA/NifB/PqqE/SkfB family radical SAM enzyme
VLQIEPTDHCNLACRMCAPHRDAWPTVHGIPKGTMSRDTWRAVLRRLIEEDCHFDHVILQWLGDPSVHPDFETMVVEATRELRGRVGHVRFDTNAVTLTPARIETILRDRDPATRLLAVFTVDAATAATYARVKGRDALPRVRAHIRHLLARRREFGPVDVQLQFVVQPGNAHEAAAFLRYWAAALRCHGAGHGHGEILFKRLSVDGGAEGQAAADALYERTLREAGIVGGTTGDLTISTWEVRPWQRDDAHAGRGPCPGAWYTPVIRHDGALLMCCADLHGELALGSVVDSGFRALWNGVAATGLRLDHLAGRFVGACAACGGVNWYALDADDAARTRGRAQELGISR